MISLPCKNCGKGVLLDKNKQPSSKYWISDPNDPSIIADALCNAQCATELKDMQDREAK